MNYLYHSIFSIYLFIEEYLMIVIALALLFVPLVRLQNDVVLPFDTPYPAFLQRDQHAYFKVVVPPTASEGNEYLIFDLSLAGEEFSDPDIMISSVTNS